MTIKGSDKADGRGGASYTGGFSGESAAKPSSNARTLRGGRDTMSTGDMADELPLKISRVKAKTKKLADRKSIPAGARRGAMGTAPLERVTTGLRTIYRAHGGSPAGNPMGEINLRA